MSVKYHRQRIQAPNSNVPIILVVEDDEDNLLFISHTLVFLGHNFLTANNGQSALELASKYDIDLVLVDLVLPDINGFDLVSCLKQNKLTQDMSIIAISALVRKQDRERAIQAGCDDYLIKPYLIDDLECKINQHLSQSFFSKIFVQKRLKGSKNKLLEMFCPRHCAG